MFVNHYTHPSIAVFVMNFEFFYVPHVLLTLSLILTAVG